MNSYGYNVDVQEEFATSNYHYFFSYSPVKNIFASTKQNEPFVLLVAHYDSVPTGPGAADDGAGIAIILEMARQFSQEPQLKNKTAFLLTDGEEFITLGARAFMKYGDWRKNCKAIIVLEARGTKGVPVLTETSYNNRWIINQYGKASPRTLASTLFSDGYALSPFLTDFTVFKDSGIPGFVVTIMDKSIYYHTPLDNVIHLDYNSFKEYGIGITRTVLNLINTDPYSPGKGKVIYADIFGKFLISLSPGTIITLLVLLTVLYLIFAVYMMYEKKLSLSGLLITVGMFFTGILFSFLFAFFLKLTAFFITKSITHWKAYPFFWIISIIGCVFSGFITALSLFRKHISCFELHMATILFWILCGLISFFFLPGLSLYCVIPLLFGLPCLISVYFFTKTLFIAEFSAASIFLTVNNVLWIEFFFILKTALEPVLLLLTVLPLLFIIIPLLYFIFRQGRSNFSLRKQAFVILSVTLLSGGLSFVLPPYSENRPQGLNFVYFHDSGTDQTRWVFMGNDTYLPREYKNTAETCTALFPWDTRKYFSRQTDNIVKMISEVSYSSKIENAKKIVNLQIVPDSHSEVLTLVLPSKTQPESVQVNGTSCNVQFTRKTNSRFSIFLACRNTPISKST